MKRLAILGPGLLGGSIGLGVKQKLPAVEVRMWGRRREALEEALRLRMADFASPEVCDVVDGADAVVLCVPIGAMEGLIRMALPALNPEALVTDVGSVKGCVVDALSPLLDGKAHFVGSHPMAGSEKAGLSAARVDLFERAVCIVTPEPVRTTEGAVSLATAFWETLGCRVRSLSPKVHDEVCSRISHVPHVAAAALVNAVSEGLPEAFDFSGPGFRDTTRVAGGLPEMWSEILFSNREAVAGGLRGLIAQLETVVQLLDCAEADTSGPLQTFLASAKQRRDALR